MSSVVNLNEIREVRNLSDFKLRNFVWYFNFYEKMFGQKPKLYDIKLKDLCEAEANRRGIEIEEVING